MEDQVLPHKEHLALGFLESLCITTKLDRVNIHQQVIKTSTMYWHERCPTDKFEKKNAGWDCIGQDAATNSHCMGQDSSLAHGPALGKSSGGSVLWPRQALRNPVSSMCNTAQEAERKRRSDNGPGKQGTNRHNFIHILLLSTWLHPSTRRSKKMQSAYRMDLGSI